jgi:pyruvate dehydrogenase E1 component alpha subunit
VDGQDVRAVHATAKRLVDRARKGEGPSFLMVNTYRYMGHHVGDVSREYYRAKQEEQQWRAERDPIQLLGNWLETQNLIDRAQLDRIQAEVKSEIEQAVQFAIAAPYPAIDKVDQDVYASN